MNPAIEELLQRTAMAKMTLDDAEYAFDELRRDLRVMIEGLEARYVWDGELEAMIANRAWKIRNAPQGGE